MRSSLAASVGVFVVTLQDTAISVAALAFFVSAAALVIVNRRINEFSGTIDEQKDRLDRLERFHPRSRN